ncbi:MAG: hypothetical protein ACI4RN_00700 [Oscillospiraceae bacterium]
MKKIKFKTGWTTAIILIAVWTLATGGMFYYATEITTSLLPFILGFLFVYPIGTFAACFWYAYKYAKIFILQIPMFIIVIIEYFFFGFLNVTPNYLIMSFLVIVLGTVIGRSFSKKEYSTIKEKIDARRIEKENAEKEYKSIIDYKSSKNNTKKK